MQWTYKIFLSINSEYCCLMGCNEVSSNKCSWFRLRLGENLYPILRFSMKFYRAVVNENIYIRNK